MKKRNGWLYILTCLLISCGYHDDNTSITYKDRNEFYSMEVRFNENKTSAVEHYMNAKIGEKNNISFSNLESNEALVLNDGTKFHLKKYPGHIEVAFDKSANSKQAYIAFKDMCEGMKEVILK